jgi:hypothetical protein
MQGSGAFLCSSSSCNFPSNVNLLKSIFSSVSIGPPFCPLASIRRGASGPCSSASRGQHPIALFQSVKSRNHCGDFQKHPRRVNIGQLGVECPNLSFKLVNCQESKVCESFPLQLLFRRLRFSVGSCDNLPVALPRYGWIQGLSYVREGNTGRPKMVNRRERCILLTPSCSRPSIGMLCLRPQARRSFEPR